MKRLFALTMMSLISLHPTAQDFKSNARAKHVINNLYQLTPDTNFHGIAGTIWNLKKINLKYDFTIKTRIFFGYNDDGGDGLAFVLQPVSDAVVGGLGNGLGYATIKPSLAVEFDTHYNPPFKDVEQDHLDFMLNGDIEHNSVNNRDSLKELPNIEDGKWHDVTFSWNATVHNLSVSFLSQTFIYRGDIINTIFHGNPSVYWGFTGGTHEAVNLQQVEIVSFIGCPFITFTAKPTPATCNQPNGSIMVNPLGGNGSYHYSKDNGATFQDANEFFNLVDRTYEIVVKDKGGLQCSSDVQPVTIIQTGSPIDNFITTLNLSDSTVCRGDSVILQATRNPNPNYKYQWLKDDINIVGATARTYTAFASGNYSVKVFDTTISCSTLTRSIPVHVIEKPHAGFDVSTTIYCAGTKVNFINTSQPLNNETAIQYLWNFGDNQTSVERQLVGHTYNTPGTYLVTLTATVATRGCTFADSINKSIKVLAVAPGVTYNDVIVPAGKSYALAARLNIGIKYSWSPPAFLSDPTSRTPTVNTSANQTYLVTITAASGCSTIDKQTVLVAKPIIGSEDNIVVDVPKAFTPNSNGMNDRLKPIPYNIQTLTYFKVYNRWGQLVFETNIIGEGWDGTLKGKLQPTETYTWILECITGNSNKIRKSGKSLLIR